MADNKYLHRYQVDQHQITEIGQNSSSLLPVKTIYEVFRVIAGKPLFIEDHLKRMMHSLALTDISYTVNISSIKQQVTELCQANGVYFGNIELKVMQMPDGLAYMAMGFIPHAYPTPQQYLEGVKLISLKVERENPQAKVKDTPVRAKTNQLLAETGAFEALLVNHNGWVTEGSRSNIFIIHHNIVYSAPDELILSGITRLHVIDVIHELNIGFKKEPFTLDQLYKADAVILCGTSPGLIAVSKVDEVQFPASHPLLKQMMQQFNDKVSKYLSE